jgi:hypothetical protein
MKWTRENIENAIFSACLHAVLVGISLAFVSWLMAVTVANFYSMTAYW